MSALGLTAPVTEPFRAPASVNSSFKPVLASPVGFRETFHGHLTIDCRDRRGQTADCA
ncbi:hypothetical protein CHELA17_62294 [Chelatococcus asaccharovorans]|nr:hypothetical protein CHELA17_62294 [Chelatococcus asaccharovorans]